MRLRDQVALTLPSFFLRVILGITFLWAGTSKLMGTYAVVGDDASRLANIGVMPVPAAPDPAPVEMEPTPEQSDDASSEPALDPIEEAVDETVNETIDDASDAFEGIIDDAKEDTNELIPESLPDLPTPPATSQYDLLSIQYAPKTYAPSDFPEPVEVKRVYSIALMISKAADPGLTQDSAPIDPIIPAMFASNPWPKALAWVAAITEIAAGAFLILGFLTRLSALGIFGVMLVALWMTQFGPSAIQSNNALLGFIPHAADPWSPGSYMVLLWQLGLGAMAMSVFFLGSGALGIDRLIFKPARRDPYIHGDPKAAKNAQTQQGDRSEFDRTPNPTP